MRHLYCRLSILACLFAGCSDATKAQTETEKELARVDAENAELKREISFLRTRIVDLDDVRGLPSDHPTKKETQRLKGPWKLVSLVHNGEQIPIARSPNTLVFSAARFIESASSDISEYWLDPSKEPKEIDLILVGGNAIGVKRLGIYSLEGGNLKICLSYTKVRPTDFECTPNSERRLLILRRP